MSMPQAECPVCGKKYAGWALLHGHDKCDCGAELVVIEKDAGEGDKTQSRELQSDSDGSRSWRKKARRVWTSVFSAMLCAGAGKFLKSFTFLTLLEFLMV